MSDALASAVAASAAASALALYRSPPKADPPEDEPGGEPEEPNIFGLPEGEPIRLRLRRFFRRQRKEVLGTVPEVGAPLPEAFAPLADWDDPMARAMTPVIGAYWQESGELTLERLGLDPDDWRVKDPHLEAMVRGASLSFCRATNATTSMQIGDALEALRREIHEGAVEQGESVAQLTKRVRRVFDRAETYRARRIAITEASRAVHAAQEQSAIESGVVAGLRWLLSSDACWLCHKIAAEVGQVRLGQAFATVGHHPDYSTIKYPPGHPGCRCTAAEVLLAEYGGPDDPKWGPPLDQPGGPKPEAPAKPKPKPRPETPPPAPAPAPKADPAAELKAKLAAIPITPGSTKAARAAISGWLKEHARPAGDLQISGMSEPESMAAFRYGGIEWRFPEGKDGPGDAIAFTLLNYSRVEFPPELARHTRSIVLTAQRNRFDAEWGRRYGNADFRSAATGGAGGIEVYGGESVGADVIAHEMGHSLAEARYGSADLHAAADFLGARGSAEPPPTKYAAVDSAEDFAESVKLYATERDRLEAIAPRRYAVIARMMEDPSYGG